MCNIWIVVIFFIVEIIIATLLISGFIKDWIK